MKTAAFKRDEAKIQAFTANEGNKLSELVAPEGVTADAPAQDAATLENHSRMTSTIYTKVIAAAHNNIGLLRAEQQDFRNAAEQFRLAGKWDPQLEGLNFNLGLALYKAELYEEAIAPLAKRIEGPSAKISRPNSCWV